MFLQTARMRREAPSAMIGVGCDYCAFCFDQALLLRDNARDYMAGQKAKREADNAVRDAEMHALLPGAAF